MDLHFNRHHQAYITNLNKALAAQAEAVATSDLVKQLELQPAIKFNAGGHINHTLFWESLSPPSPQSSSTSAAASEAAPSLHKAILSTWGSFESFQSAMETTALGIQGSGWVWLLVKPSGGNPAGLLEITTSKDQDLPALQSGSGKLGIVLGVDMWEHAYYLQYWNDKKEYLNKIWNVINWSTAEKRYQGGNKDARVVFGDLVGLASRL
jgi:Fe-Mn family superoxide dismutase